MKKLNKTNAVTMNTVQSYVNRKCGCGCLSKKYTATAKSKALQKAQ